MTDEVQRAPHNIDAEQALLGALLIDNKTFDRVRHIIRAEHFYDQLHADIFGQIAARINDGKTASPTLLRPAFEEHAGMAEIGGPAYLARLAGAAIATVAAPEHAEQIRDLWMKRQIIDALDEAHAAVRSDQDMAAVAAAVEAQMMTIHDNARPQARAESAVAAAARAVEAMNEAYAAERATGIQTGIPEIDERTGGMQPAEVWTLAGRPSMGKTAVALHVCKSVAEAGQPVLFFSLEMDGMALMQRVCSSIIRRRDHAVPYQAMRTPHKLSEPQFRCVVEGMMEVEGMPLHITPPSMRDIGAMRAEARAVARKTGGLGLICVDYVQLVNAPGREAIERLNNALAAIKGLAADHACPVLSLAQLSREVERRSGTNSPPRPQMGDLKGSGKLEEDSDVVLLVHRDEYYLQRMALPEDSAKRAKLFDLREAAKGKIDLICPKFRGGEIFDAQVDADLPTNTILPPAAPTQKGFQL